MVSFDAYFSESNHFFLQEDPWQNVRILIDSFNENRRTGFSPGRNIVVDEVMSAWKGQEGKYAASGAPHVTKIARKPEGVGAELKAAADGQTNIMLSLDIMEGKERQGNKKYAHIGSEGTAICMRLCEHYFASGRVIHADSAFSSVKTCRHLRDHGLHFMGCVKTARKFFPIKYLKSFEDDYGHGREKERGGWKLVQSNKDEDGNEHEPIYGLAWYDRKAKFIVSSCGATHDGEPSLRKRHKRRVENNEYVTRVWYKQVKRPKMVEEFFSCFSNVDIHDHYRQGSLEMERNWITKKWYHRIFTTVFGICVVDAFFAYKFECQNAAEEAEDFNYFLGRLAHQLIFNVYLDQGMAMRDNQEQNEDDEMVSHASYGHR
jgi:hypothetical protein